MAEDPYTPLRQMMSQVIAAHAQATAEHTGLPAIDPKILAIMERVPRHEYVPVEIRAYAHSDGPLPIGFDKTISQPFIAALMTELLDLQPNDVVLEIGTGLGYHTAILSELAKKVYSVEIIEELAEEAATRLEHAGRTNVELRTGNGYYGWPEHSPYDKIMVAAAPELIPPPLIGQLKPGGRMVLPAGLDTAQQLMVVDKDANGKISTREILAVRFAPLEGIDGHH
jgi:protein-L-isoaspartate(D-aspartate) O-methyltransferase